MIRSDKLRRSAKGQDCHLNIHGVCNYNPETTILAHLKIGSSMSGMGMKTHDVFATFSCNCCHDVMDGRTKVNNKLITDSEYHEYALNGMGKTFLFWFDNGYLEVK